MSHHHNMCVPTGLGSSGAWRSQVPSKACVSPEGPVGSSLRVLAQGGCCILCANKVGTASI